ncbi:UNKNOWN [Stylonychia lemnae]|uniref:Uncharacterized protein n=1 Tax=Stylonychia lemnae TaxID=5949 RepID=A0A078A0A2_STYLE|nr:UNKNOWN [Stylonychia lemnae]|eukprot:CDW75307.1 UNKNOWN [Stylonychia lemnae]
MIYLVKGHDPFISQEVKIQMPKIQTNQKFESNSKSIQEKEKKIIRVESRSRSIKKGANNEQSSSSSPMKTVNSVKQLSDRKVSDVKTINKSPSAASQLTQQKDGKLNLKVFQKQSNHLSSRSIDFKPEKDLYINKKAQDLFNKYLQNDQNTVQTNEDTPSSKNKESNSASKKIKFDLPKRDRGQRTKSQQYNALSNSKQGVIIAGSPNKLNLDLQQDSQLRVLQNHQQVDEVLPKQQLITEIAIPKQNLQNNDQYIQQQIQQPFNMQNQQQKKKVNHSKSPSFSQNHAEQFAQIEAQRQVILDDQQQQDERRSVRFFIEETVINDQIYTQERNQSQEKQKKNENKRVKDQYSVEKKKENSYINQSDSSSKIEKPNYQNQNSSPQSEPIIKLQSTKIKDDQKIQSFAKQTQSSVKKRQDSIPGPESSFAMIDQQKSIFDLMSGKKDQTAQSKFSEITEQNISPSKNDQFTFKPQLNEISNIIAKKKKEQLKEYFKEKDKELNLRNSRSLPKNHFELLYRLDTERKKQQQQKIHEQGLLKEMDELRQCTFKPQLEAQNSQAQGIAHMNHLQRSSSDFYQRNLQWLEQKDTKVKGERKKEKKEKVKECTFKPNLRQSDHSYQNLQKSSIPEKNNGQVKGMDIFIKRLQEAQQRKMEEMEVFLLPSQKRQKKYGLLKGQIEGQNDKQNNQGSFKESQNESQQQYFDSNNVENDDNYSRHDYVSNRAMVDPVKKQIKFVHDFLRSSDNYQE